MTNLVNHRLGGAKFPVALVLGLTAVTWLATPVVEAQFTPETQLLLAERIDPGSVVFVQAETYR